MFYPSLQIDTSQVDFGCLLNNSSATKSVILYNNSPIEVDYIWTFVDTHLESTEKQFCSRRRCSSSPEGRRRPSTKQRRCSSTPSRIDCLQISNALSIEPRTGSVKPWDSVPAYVNYTGYSNIRIQSTALCKVNGGQAYAVTVIAQSAERHCTIESDEVSFGEIIFGETTSRALKICNEGLVPSNFCITHDLNDTGLSINPLEGIVSGKSTQLVEIIMKPRLPKDFVVFAKITINNGQTNRVRIHGKACFPHISLDQTLNPSCCEDQRAAVEEQLIPVDSFRLVIDFMKPIVFSATLSGYDIDMGIVPLGSIKRRLVQFSDVVHAFDVKPHIKRSHRKILSRRGIFVRFQRAIEVILDATTLEETDNIDVKIPIGVSALQNTIRS